MNVEKYDKELVEVFVRAVTNSIFALRETHKEEFYYYDFIFDAGLHPYISAWSYEALEKSMINNKIINEKEKNW